MAPPQFRPVRISGAGSPGISGTQTWHSGYRSSGSHGRHAAHATPGQHAQDLKVRVGYQESRPGQAQVWGDGGHLGRRRWGALSDEIVLLDSQGGAGGNGGIGENGEQGSHGSCGRDATQYSNATDGSNGGDGGDAGRGSNGADGGDGGRIHISVDEVDLDTLSAVAWDFRGGRGGACGKHGVPGTGGYGGSGGSGCSWTETHYRQVTDAQGRTTSEPYTTHHSRPGGSSGMNGSPGRPQTAKLYAGRDGADGQGQIEVQRGGQIVGRFKSRYHLVIEDFEVVDENDDGVYEPGEYLIVKNVKVKNVGGMPSPEFNALKVLIESTKWLQPVLSEPIEVPRAIQPGETRTVDGQLRAFIQYENVVGQRADMSVPLRAEDAVTLVATFERLGRELPEFRKGVPVLYQYPLELIQPRYLECVSKIATVKFSWTVKNISNRPYGIDGALRRAAETRITDPGHMFDYKLADPEKPHEVSDEIEELGPGEEVTVTQPFHVNDDVDLFTSGQMFVSLLLSDPHCGAIQPIASFRLPIQVSASYTRNPLARFLLLVHASTPNEPIKQTMDFIGRELYLPFDVFNLSLFGSFKSPVTGRNVVTDYPGRMVIVFGDEIKSFFQKGPRRIWDLLDPQVVSDSARGGTSFLFVRPRPMESIRVWAHHVAFPTPLLPRPETKPKAGISSVVDQLAADSRLSPACHLSFAVRKMAFRNLEKRELRKAMFAKQRLGIKLPLRRFLTAPSDHTDGGDAPASPKTGMVAVTEGLPHSAKIVATLEPEHHTGAVIREHNAAMIVHALPFKYQCAIFWNIFGLDKSLGVRVDVAYMGDRLTEVYDSCRDEDMECEIDSKIFKVLNWTISTQIASELSRFCLNSSWPDRSSSSTISHLPLLRQFINSSPTETAELTEDGLLSLEDVIGPLVGVASPLGFREWISQRLLRVGNRKTKTRTCLRRECDRLLKALYVDKTERRQASKRLAVAAKEARILLKRIKEGDRYSRMDERQDRAQRAHTLACQALSDLTSTSDCQFVELADLAGVGRSVAMSREQVAGRRAELQQAAARRKMDATMSAKKLGEMVEFDKAGAEDDGTADTDEATEASEASEVDEKDLDGGDGKLVETSAEGDGVGDDTLVELDAIEESDVDSEKAELEIEVAELPA